jgi:hypothetical protein
MAFNRLRVEAEGDFLEQYQGDTQAIEARQKTAAQILRQAADQLDQGKIQEYETLMKQFKDANSPEVFELRAHNAAEDLAATLQEFFERWDLNDSSEDLILTLAAKIREERGVVEPEAPARRSAPRVEHGEGELQKDITENQYLGARINMVLVDDPKANVMEITQAQAARLILGDTSESKRGVSLNVNWLKARERKVEKLISSDLRHMKLPLPDEAIESLATSPRLQDLVTRANRIRVNHGFTLGMVLGVDPKKV